MSQNHAFLWGSHFPDSRFVSCICTTAGLLLCWPYVLYFAGRQLVSRRKRHKAQLTPPVPVRRKRALTLPLKSASMLSVNMIRRKKTSEQSDAGIFKLPVEIRVMIYEEMFRGDVLVELVERKLMAWRIYGNERRIGVDYHRKYSSFSELSENMRRPRKRRKNMGVLPLLRSCRRIYSETVNLLYSTPTIRFHTATAFLAFYSTILPQRSNSIRYLTFDFPQAPESTLIPSSKFTYSNIKCQGKVRNQLPRLGKYAKLWDHCCNLMEHMSGLRKLQVIVDPEKFCDWEWSTNGTLLYWLQPLMEKGVDMEVRIGGNVGRVWVWDNVKEEVKWMTTDGELIYRQKGEGEMIWYDLLGNGLIP